MKRGQTITGIGVLATFSSLIPTCIIQANLMLNYSESVPPFLSKPQFAVCLNNEACRLAANLDYQLIREQITSYRDTGAFFLGMSVLITLVGSYMMVDANRS